MPFIQDVRGTKQEEIGRRVKYLRLQRQMNQTTLAALLEWKIPYLSRFEKGLWTMIDPEKLIQIASIFDVSVDQLVGNIQNIYDVAGYQVGA